MFYNSADIDEELHCSFCKQKFKDVVKLVPICGESICGECSDALLEGMNKAREFKCQICQKKHTMPAEGLTEAKSLSRMLKKRKLDKPLTNEAKKLKSELVDVQKQLSALKSFEPRQHVEDYCDRLEKSVIGSVGCLILNFNLIKEQLKKEINEYRQQCLETAVVVPGPKTRARSHEVAKRAESDRKKLDMFSPEIELLSKKWNDFFNRPDMIASDSEIRVALNLATDWTQKLR